ncbi:MAG: outer membrane protein assembly factor BamD [Bacteroidota bacterium]|nr:outer membrane protein assembly factor BamD [Bacteroidota bacterium]
MKLILILFVPFLILASSCNNQFNKVLKSTDYDYKLKMADKYYAAKNYNKAEQLYVELFPIFKGSDKFEELYYKYAYCSFYQQNYLDAENLFKGFLGVFPNSTKAEEIAYVHALTFYKQSPKVELEQINTTKAIGMMQSFISTYPNSSRIGDANKIIALCRAKLELKDYKSAELYYNIEQYRAAGISFINLINSYPESEKGQEYMLMAIKSYFKFAKLSIPDKQEERYQKVATEYFDFADRFPESKLLKEAEDYKNISLNNIKQLQNEQIKTPANR